MKSTRKLTFWQIKKKEERKKNENRNIILVNLVHINGMLTKRKLTVMSEEPVQPFKHGTSKKFLLCLLKIDQRERQIYYWTKKRIHKSQKLFQPQYISHLLPLYGSFLVLRVGIITKWSHTKDTDPVILLTMDRTVGGSCSGSPTSTNLDAICSSAMRTSSSVHWHAYRR